MTNKAELPDLDRLEALARAATPGPWQVLTDEHETYAESYVHKERRIFTAEIDPQLGDIYPVVNSSRGIAAEKGDPPIWMVSMEQENADFIAAANPAAVLALIELARRAQPEGGIPQLSKAFMTVESNGGEGRHIVLKFNQREDAYAVHDFLLKAGRQDSRASAKPEGEAPQAVPVKPWREAFRDQYPNYPQVELPWETKFNWAELEIAQLRAAPAAQHAESGAQAADHVRQKFEAWAEDVGYPTRRGFGNANDYDFVQTRRMWESWQAALAAQSQGAQPTVTFSVDGTSMSPWEYIDYLHDQLAAKAEAPALTPLDYRAQGREEALAIIMAESAEDPFSDCIGWGKSGAPEDEGESYWDEDKLRALLHIGDKKHDAYDRSEAAYWDALGHKDEAKREMLLVEQAPFYKPLIDFLAKHEAWDLMADLKSAQQAAAPGAEPMPEPVSLTARPLLYTETVNDQQVRRDDLWIVTTHVVNHAAASELVSAPGTPEAPADDALLLRVVVEHGMQLHFEGRGEDDAVWVDDLMKWSDGDRLAATRALIAQAVKQRAAQLDGGQGEGDKA